MITVYLVIGFQAKAAVQTIDRSPASERFLSSKAIKKSKAAQNICTIDAGDVGKLRYKGRTYEEAFEKVTDACFTRRNNQYIKARSQQPSQDRQIQFIDSCVNSVNCI